MVSLLRMGLYLELPWETAPDRPVLGADVHFWFVAGLEAPANHAAAIRTKLIPEECGRFDRFRTDQDRFRFARSRIFLRNVLARYLNREPAEISFSVNQNGKPAVGGQLRFNLSRSGDVAVLGVSTSEIGVDVEQVRDIPDIENIARAQFSSAESRFLADQDNSTELFFQLWAGKEAFIKGIGLGLSCPLASFSVAPLRVGPRRVVPDHSAAAEHTGWQLANLQLLATRYAAGASPALEPDV
jgi:4'-phosphopantetheinyl transferase